MSELQSSGLNPDEDDANNPWHPALIRRLASPPQPPLTVIVGALTRVRSSSNMPHLGIFGGVLI